MLFFTLLLWKKGYISGDPLFYSGTFIWNMMLVQISFHPPLPPSCETRWKNIHFSNECGREPQKLPSGCFWMLRMRYLITILYFMFLMYLCIMVVATYIRTYTIYYLYIHLVLASQESSNICRSWGQRFMPGICCFSLRFATIFPGPGPWLAKKSGGQVRPEGLGLQSTWHVWAICRLWNCWLLCEQVGGIDVSSR